jgi:RHS repeat-associated protein
VPLAQHQSGVSTFFELDPNHTVTSLTDPSGSVVGGFTYDSFGRIESTSGSVSSRFRYTGREYDPETGLLYYRHRYLDPEIGRFLSEDPIGLNGGINAYAYVGNDPINWVDPLGEARSRADCWKLLKQIENMSAKLAKEIAKYDPVKDGMGGWPMKGGKLTKPGGHYIEMGFLAGGIVAKVAEYYKDCRDYEGMPSVRQCVWNNVKRFRALPKPVIKTSFEDLQMERSARLESEFWEDILIGDIAIGTVMTGGALGGFQGVTLGTAGRWALIFAH